MTMTIALWLHLLSVTVWVGGMFFAYVVLRPVAVGVLEAPQRLTLWNGVLARFFPWVWASIILILVGGLHMWMLLGGGKAPVHTHIMLLLGLLMMAIFVWIYFFTYRQLKQAVNNSQWPAGGEALAKIRRMVGFNLLLGMLTISVAILWRWS